MVLLSFSCYTDKIKFRSKTTLDGFWRAASTFKAGVSNLRAVAQYQVATGWRELHGHSAGGQQCKPRAGGGAGSGVIFTPVVTSPRAWCHCRHKPPSGTDVVESLKRILVAPLARRTRSRPACVHTLTFALVRIRHPPLSFPPGRQLGKVLRDSRAAILSPRAGTPAVPAGGLAR